MSATDISVRTPDRVRLRGCDVECLEGEFPRKPLTCDAAVILSDDPITSSAWALCGQWLAQFPETPVVLVAGFGKGPRCVQVGAQRVPVRLDRLIEALEAAGNEFTPFPRDGSFDGMVGSSPAVEELRRILVQVSPSPSSVLITGETGTGKELAARALHAHGPRRDQAFVALNCAAMPEALLESDLFGHARGAFTGAMRGREGLLQHARGGTIFLDEIGDMPLGVQAKLLRALQERRVRPVGSDDEVSIDIRVVAATHQDLTAQVRSGRFREDLLYRLNVVQIDVPPLRERGEDVLLIARHFLAQFAAQAQKAVSALSPGVCARLLAYPWPGNVRELRNCIERGVTMTTEAVLGEEDLPATVAGFRRSAPPSTDLEVLLPLAEVERRYIMRVLEVVGGNKARASRILGVDRRTLYRRLEQYEEG